MSRKGMMRIVSLAAAIFAASFPASAQAPELAMLSNLTPGNWEVRLRGNGGTQNICVRSGRELIQLKHPQSGCSQYVVEDDVSEVTVQYTCQGDGYGRTTIRREGNSLVQIRSQGIQGGTPFSMQGEARRTGSC